MVLNDSIDLVKHYESSIIESSPNSIYLPVNILKNNVNY